MIIARITVKGEPLCMGSCEITGSPADDDYRQGGWFPVESFNIGSEAKKEEAATDKKPDAKDGKSHPVKQPSTTTQQTDEKKRFTTTIKKEIDYATPFLMLKAMEERSKKKSTDVDELAADIHVLGSVAFKDSKERFVYPSLMIHLEKVHVSEWTLDGSGNNRPSESFKLQYDKAAIRYGVTPDGKSYDPATAVGWDQNANARWTDIDVYFEKYRPKVSR